MSLRICELGSGVILDFTKLEWNIKLHFTFMLNLWNSFILTCRKKNRIIMLQCIFTRNIVRIFKNLKSQEIYYKTHLVQKDKNKKTLFVSTPRNILLIGRATAWFGLIRSHGRRNLEPHSTLRRLWWHGSHWKNMRNRCVWVTHGIYWAWVCSVIAGHYKRHCDE